MWRSQYNLLERHFSEHTKKCLIVQNVWWTGYFDSHWNLSVRKCWRSTEQNDTAVCIHSGAHVYEYGWLGQYSKTRVADSRQQISPRDVRPTNRISLGFLSSKASRLVTVIPCPLSITVRTWESGESSHRAPELILMQSPLWELAPSFTQRKAFQRRPRWAGPLHWWRLLWLLPGDCSQPELNLTAWSQKAD